VIIELAKLDPRDLTRDALGCYARETARRGLTVQLPLEPPQLDQDHDEVEELLTDAASRTRFRAARPVFGAANSEATLFKIDPDGMHATRVNGRFGRSLVNTIEVVEGLQPGDHVILSDMRAYAGQSRIRLQ
jgi:hypothetical protein